MKLSVFASVLLLGAPAILANEFQVCDSGTLGERENEAFRHSKNYIITAFSSAHSSNDAIGTDQEAVNIVGKFSYGLVLKDLEDEAVEVFMDDCSGSVRHLGNSLTNENGESNLVLDAQDLPSFGRYKIIHRVSGDGTTVESNLTILPEGTKLFVFDIDGTLTTSDVELWKEIGASTFSIGYDQSPREGAAAATRFRHEVQGYHLVYLTGRYFSLTQTTRDWLVSKECAPGTLQLAPTLLDVIPTDAGAGTYKANYLKSLQAKGFHLAGAYGNSGTDIYAYNEAGIVKSQTFILGDEGGEEDTVSVGEDYRDHLATLAEDRD